MTEFSQIKKGYSEFFYVLQENVVYTLPSRWISFVCVCVKEGDLLNSSKVSSTALERFFT